MTMTDQKTNQPEVKEEREITFKCKFCGEVKPLREMVRIDRFFPPVTACAGCNKNMDNAH